MIASNGSAVPAPAGGSASHHRPDIQGLRAVAVLLVVAFHAGLPVPGGFVGVDVFFVISGFVITGLLLRQWSSTGRIALGDFYARRIRRLLPALALVVSATCGIAILVQPPNGEQQHTAQTALGAMLLSANVIIPRLSADYFARGATVNPLLHTWSLSAEEQFYLVYPGLLALALAAALRQDRRTRVPLVVIGIGTMASAALLLAATYAPHMVGAAGRLLSPFYSSPTRAWEFGTGALVALAADGVQRSSNAARLSAGFVGAGLVLGTAFAIDEHTLFPGFVVFVPVAGASLMLASGIGQPHLLSRSLGAAPLVWIGDISYSWYLWHWPAIVFGRLVFPGLRWIPLAGAIVSLVLGALSFRFLENPVRNARELGGRRLFGLAGLATGTAVLLGGVLGLGARAGWGQPWALGAHVVLQRGCDAGEFDPERCRWRTENASGSVLLLGDSQAWALADGLIPAAHSLGYDAIVASHNACAFALPSNAFAGWSMTSPDCVARNERLIRYALDARPRVVVIANQSRAYAGRDIEAWRASLSPAVRRFREAGLGVVIVNVMPFADEQATRTSLLLKPTGERYTLLPDQRVMRREADAADRLVAADNPGTVVFDPTPVFCDAERCRVAYQGIELYSDGSHLSRSGALQLEVGLRESLLQAAQPDASSEVGIR